MGFFFKAPKWENKIHSIAVRRIGRMCRNYESSLARGTDRPNERKRSTEIDETRRKEVSKHADENNWLDLMFLWYNACGRHTYSTCSHGAVHSNVVLTLGKVYMWINSISS